MNINSTGTTDQFGLILFHLNKAKTQKQNERTQIEENFMFTGKLLGTYSLSQLLDYGTLLSLLEARCALVSVKSQQTVCL